MAEATGEQSGEVVLTLASIAGFYRGRWNMQLLQEHAKDQALMQQASVIVEQLPAEMSTAGWQQLKDMPKPLATMCMALCASKRGKGGRACEPDPFCNPDIDPVEAQHIVNRRRSAALSKFVSKVYAVFEAAEQAGLIPEKTQAKGRRISSKAKAAGQGVYSDSDMPPHDKKRHQQQQQQQGRQLHHGSVKRQKSLRQLLQGGGAFAHTGSLSFSLGGSSDGEDEQDQQGDLAQAQHEAAEPCWALQGLDLPGSPTLAELLQMGAPAELPVAGSGQGAPPGAANQQPYCHGLLDSPQSSAALAASGAGRPGVRPQVQRAGPAADGLSTQQQVELEMELELHAALAAGLHQQERQAQHPAFPQGGMLPGAPPMAQAAPTVGFGPAQRNLGSSLDALAAGHRFEVLSGQAAASQPMARAGSFHLLQLPGPPPPATSAVASTLSGGAYARQLLPARAAGLGLGAMLAESLEAGIVRPRALPALSSTSDVYDSVPAARYTRHPAAEHEIRRAESHNQLLLKQLQIAQLEARLQAQRAELVGMLNHATAALDMDVPGWQGREAAIGVSELRPALALADALVPRAGLRQPAQLYSAGGAAEASGCTYFGGAGSSVAAAGAGRGVSGDSMVYL